MLFEYYEDEYNSAEIFKESFLERRKEELSDPEKVYEYLQKCKEQNLKDYDDLLAGRRYCKP